MNRQTLAAIGGLMLAFGCFLLALDPRHTVNLVIFVILMAFGVIAMTYGLSGEEERPKEKI